jgi:signal recognition particle receptor subunit beta
MGAGKSTAIGTLSEIDVVATEAANSERDVADKPTTTVALDYGEITVGQDDKVRLYGVPGQRRFDFMWEILKERAIGMVLLVNNDAPDPIAQALEFLADFEELHGRGGVVIGVSRTDIVASPSVEDYSDAIAVARPDLLVPVFTVDTRNEDHMRMLLMTLILNIEMRAAIAPTPKGMSQA